MKARCSAIPLGRAPRQHPRSVVCVQASRDFRPAAATDSARKALVDSLAEAGLDPKAGTAPMRRDLEDATQVLLGRAQDAGAVRPDVELPEVIALITALCLAADRQQWNETLRIRTLDVVFDGFRVR
ncbi:hypothetical protein ABZ863_18360 [Saccharomonospora sp. NPDC046836]|uniref:SbtR family transcriptional regulator n=1 Tax=Saccharomonospora sp. NPDC046836 TaxID=3156921 RepID=UPI00340E48B6